MAGIRDFLYLVQISDAALTHVTPTWEYLDYTPEFNRLYFILSGQGMVRVGDQEFHPGAGDLVLLPAQVRQSFGCTGPDTYTKYWCHFTCPVGDRDLFNHLQVPTVMRAPDPASFERQFTTLLHHFSQSDLLSHLRVRAALLELIASLLEAAGVTALPFQDGTGDERLRPVLRYIEENLASPLNLSELASRAHLQETYFVGYFKKHLGLPPMRWIHTRRMERAKSLLSASELLVTEVAQRVGMPDVFHFSKDFKAFTGFSPSEYRVMKKG